MPSFHYRFLIVMISFLFWPTAATPRSRSGHCDLKSLVQTFDVPWSQLSQKSYSTTDGIQIHHKEKDGDWCIYL